MVADDLTKEPTILNDLPKEFQTFSGALGWCGKTESGFWVLQYCRVHYNCLREELPEFIQRLVIPAKGENYVLWKPEKEFLRWLQLLARHASSKPAHVFMEDTWVYNSGSEFIESRFLSEPPLGAVGYGFDAQFLAEALIFVLGKNMREEALVQLTECTHNIHKQIPAWLFTAYQKTACLMPVVK